MSPKRPIYSRQLNGIYPAETLRVIDGDTVEIRVSIWLGQEVITKGRLRGIDAPELKARCPSELQLAQEASPALKNLLAQGQSWCDSATERTGSLRPPGSTP